VQDIEMRALVFMDPLDLNVKERVGVGHDPCAVADQLRKKLLVVTFDRAPPLPESGVLRKGLQFL